VFISVAGNTAIFSVIALLKDLFKYKVHEERKVDIAIVHKIHFNRTNVIIAQTEITARKIAILEYSNIYYYTDNIKVTESANTFKTLKFLLDQTYKIKLKGLSVKYVRSQGKGVLSDADVRTFRYKTSDSSKFMVCPPDKRVGGGRASADIFRTRERVNFSRFCADDFFGRCLTVHKHLKDIKE